MVNADFDRTKKCVDYYVKLGLCPLPSRMDCKGPMLPTYAKHYGPAPVPSWVYRSWTTTNVQVLTGTKTPTPTKIVVVDLDGPEAMDAWDRIAAHHGYTPKKGWIATTGSGGRHHYFLLQDGMSECASGILWGLFDTWGWGTGSKIGNGGWCKHKEVRLLADHALVVAPPSVHVDTGCRYEFDAESGPNVVRLPELAPEWLVNMPRLVAPRFIAPPSIRQYVYPMRNPDNHYTREEVLAAVGTDKFDLARNEWGLVSSANNPNLSGWCPCYVPGREDPRFSRPSGSFNFQDGTFQDRKDMSCVSFFDLAVVLGVYRTWQECRDDLGDRYIGRRTTETKSAY